MVACPFPPRQVRGSPSGAYRTGRFGLGVASSSVAPTTRHRTPEVLAGGRVVARQLAQEKRVVARQLAQEKRVVARQLAQEKRVVARQLAQEKRVVARQLAPTVSAESGG